MEVINFKSQMSDSDVDSWIKQQYIRDLSGDHSNVINLMVKTVYTVSEDQQTILIDDVYDQIFIATCYGSQLDLFGDDFLLNRNGLSDTDYRNLLIGYSSLTVDGATLKTLKDYIENTLGYTINNVVNTYYDFYDPDLGGNGDGDTGDLIMSIATSAFRNHLTYIEVDETITENEIEQIELKIKDFHKINNFVKVRNDL